MLKKALTHLKKDAALAAVIERVGVLPFEPKGIPPYESLVTAVIYQQLSGKAAGTILGRFKALFSDDSFPTPEEILQATDERLRSAGLSRAKATYVKAIAEAEQNGSIPTLKECEALTNEEILESLTAIKGVGRWTAEMFLMFNLGRPDVLPVNDLGVRQGYQIVYKKRKMPEPKALDRYGKKWKPYRTIAALYLWAVVDS